MNFKSVVSHSISHNNKKGKHPIVLDSLQPHENFHFHGAENYAKFVKGNIKYHNLFVGGEDRYSETDKSCCGGVLAAGNLQRYICRGPRTMNMIK